MELHGELHRISLVILWKQSFSSEKDIMSDADQDTAGTAQSDRAPSEGYTDPWQRYIPPTALQSPQKLAEKDKSDVEKYVDAKIEQLRRSNLQKFRVLHRSILDSVCDPCVIY